MKQIRLMQVDVSALVQGMYIAELDRPWLGSPFLLEGFLLESLEQLEQLRSICKYVKVDTERSDFASTRLLLDMMHAPAAAKPDADSRGVTPAPPRHATASLLDTPAPREPGEGSGRSLLSEFRTVLGEVIAGRPKGADQPGPLLSAAISTRQARQGRKRQRDAAAIPGAPSERPVQALPASAAYINIHADKAQSRKSRPLHFRPKRQGRHGPDPDADRAQLSGTPLIVPQERTFEASPQLEEAHRIHTDAMALMEQFLDDVRNQRELDLDSAQKVIADISESIAENPDPLIWLTHLKREDNYAGQHAIDCAVHMIRFGRQLGFARETRQALGLGGLLFDIGKLRVSSELRSHTGRLSKVEFDAMKEHVMHSIDILHTIPNMPKAVLEIVAQHHERVDGSGYPFGFKGKEINRQACMAAIIDAYTALITQRPHAPALTIHAALQTLDRWKGLHFHASLVEEFMQCVGIFPVGTLVELNTREVGVVVAQNRIRKLQPTIMLLMDQAHQRYAWPSMLNLMLEPITAEQEPYRILRDLPPGSYDLDPTEFYAQAS